MIPADSNKKFVLFITDAFTKYAVVSEIASKDTETVADAMYRLCTYQHNIGRMPCAKPMTEYLEVTTPLTKCT